MSALKKRIISHNVSRFLKENLLVLFFNYNHINTEEWHSLKKELSFIKGVESLVVKNRIAKSVINKEKKKKRRNEKKKKKKTQRGYETKKILYCIIKEKKNFHIFSKDLLF